MTIRHSRLLFLGHPVQSAFSLSWRRDTCA